jgi:hypothetical protein
MFRSNIAAWNGTSWQPLGQGLMPKFLSCCYNNDFMPAGSFTLSDLTVNGANGRLSWQAVGIRMDDEDGCACYWYNSMLIMGGKFTNLGQEFVHGMATWYQLGSGMDDDVSL